MVLKRFPLLFKYIFNLYSRMAFLLTTIQLNGKKQENNQKRCGMFLLTVAFNNEFLIEKQIEQIRLMIKDSDYQHVVVDNSLKRKKRKLIESVCLQNNIEYFQIPYLISLLFHFQSGISHGAALNWLYYHYLQVKEPLRFSLLDHDIFPVRSCDMTLTLGNRDFYGVSRLFGEEWYLWPGFCIFNFDAFTTEPNFLPLYTKYSNKNYLDTGGGNYMRYYYKYNVTKVEFPIVETKRIRNSKGLVRRWDIYHSDCIQIIDNVWLHLINGSNYAKIKGKDAFIKEAIDDVGAIYKKSFC